MSGKPDNNGTADDATAYAIYDTVRRKQLDKRAAEDKRLRKRNAVKIQYIGFRKRLAVFALSMTGLMGFYMMSFVLGMPEGIQFGESMDKLTLGIIGICASALPNGEQLAAPLRNVISFTPLGIVFGAVVVSLCVTAAVAFFYCVVVTSREKDRHESNFMME